MDEIMHHFETMGNHCLLVFTGESNHCRVSWLVRNSQPSTVGVGIPHGFQLTLGKDPWLSLGKEIHFCLLWFSG